jgi:hypothetical protein
VLIRLLFSAAKNYKFISNSLELCRATVLSVLTGYVPRLLRATAERGVRPMSAPAPCPSSGESCPKSTERSTPCHSISLPNWPLYDGWTRNDWGNASPNCSAKPPASNRTWLIKRLAWRLQALAEGDLSQRAAELANDAALRLNPPDRLVTPVALRSLASGHPDYKSRYSGHLRSRAVGYH